MIFTIAIVIAVLAVVAGALILLLTRRQLKEGRTSETNYRVFFITGLVMLGLGVINVVLYFVMQIPFYIGLPMVIIGGVYAIIGWVHRSTWQKTGDKLL